MAESVKMEFTGDAAGLEVALKKVQAENAKLKMQMEATAKAGTKGYKEQTSAIEEMRKFSARTTEQVKTDGERQAEALQKLRVAYHMNGISAETYRRAVERVKQEHDKAKDSSAELGDESASTTAAMFTGFVSVTGAVTMLNAELTNTVQLQEKVRERQVTAGRSMDSLAFNAGGDMSQETFRGMVRDIGKASDGTLLTNPDQMMQGAAGAISSIAENDPEKRAARTVAVARAVREVATDANVSDLMATTAQLGQVTGAQTEADFRRSLALASSGMGMANITDAKGMGFAARAGAVTLANAADGVDREQVMKDSLALWAATSVQLKDRTGEVSASAIGDFSKSLRTFSEENALTGKTDMERLAQIRADAGLAEAFREKVGGGQAQPLFQKLLDPNSEFSQMVAANQATIRPDEAGLSRIGQNMRATNQQQAAAQDSELSAMEARWLEANTPAGRTAAVREVLNRGMNAAGVGASEKFFRNFDFDMGTGVWGRDAVGMARDDVQELQQGYKLYEGMGLVAKDENRDKIFEEMLQTLKRMEEKAAPPNAADARGAVGVHREQGAN